jgi:hypothetical protein
MQGGGHDLILGNILVFAGLDFGNSWTLEDNRSLEARFEHRTSKI